MFPQAREIALRQQTLPTRASDSQPGCPCEGLISTPPSSVPPAHPNGSTDASDSPGFRLGQVAGVEIHLHWSLVFIFSLVLVSLGSGLFPYWHPDWSAGQIWGTAFLASLLFFATILVHELSHALVARTQEIPIRRITLFLFGGLARMEHDAPSPKAELLMALAGPAASLLIGVVSLVAGSYLAGMDAALSAVEDPEQTFRAIGPLATLLLWLGPINLMLGLFNLIPGFPLDGGRVLRAILWAATRDRVKASRWAARSGQVVAWTLILFGALAFLRGAFLQGLWMALIGSFLNNAARLSFQQVLFESYLGPVRVDQVMHRDFDRVGPSTSVEAIVREHLFASGQRAFPVESRSGLIGLVSFDDLRKVPREAWSRTAVRDIMTPLERLVSLPPTASAAEALTLLAARDINQIPVVEDGRCTGLVQRSALMTWIAMQQEA